VIQTLPHSLPDQNKLCVLVWHYHDDDVSDRTPSPASVGQPSTTSGRPAPPAVRIDEDHSNAYAAWQRMGSPQQTDAGAIRAARKGRQLTEARHQLSSPMKGSTVVLEIPAPATGGVAASACVVTSCAELNSGTA